MLLDHSPLTYRELHTPSPKYASALYAPHAPKRNRILAALPAADFERLLPHLEAVEMPPGWVVHGARQRQGRLYFPTEGIVARLYESMPSQAVVISPGFAYRLDTRVLTTEFEHDGPLPQLLLQYTQSLMAQTWQIAACNGRHSLEQQVCRLILSFLDRLPSNELVMTQELISAMLGVRRESITEIAGMLQRAGEIHYRRGHIAVLDRSGLEVRACECYRAMRLDPPLLQVRRAILGSLARQ